MRDEVVLVSLMRTKTIFDMKKKASNRKSPLMEKPFQMAIRIVRLYQYF